MGNIVGAAAGNLGFGAAQGLIEGGINQIFAGANSRRDWKYKQKEMALQQQYALEQMERQSQLAYDQWQKQFDYENEYNDPSKLFARYAAAGINPAAVLGSSGVSVQGTMSGGSAPSPSGGMPRAGGIGQGSNIRLDPTQLSQLEVNESTADRNQAAADRDSAEAVSIRNQTQSKEYYANVAQLNKSILEANVEDSQAVADMNRALATIYQADAQYADLMATYKFEDFVAQYSLHREEYFRFRRYNVEYMDRILESQVILDLARAWESFNSGRTLAVESEIAKVRLDDLRNWFDVNWNTQIPVPVVNEKGKPTGGHKMLTGKEIHSYLLGLDVTHGNQQTAGTWFSNRSEKNALGYSMLKAVVQGAAGMATSYVGARTLGAGISSSTTSSTSGGSTARSVERYDSKGNLVGYTIENMTSEGHTAGRSRGRRSR